MSSIKGISHLKSKPPRGRHNKVSHFPGPVTQTVIEANADNTLQAGFFQTMMDSLKADIFGKIDSSSPSLHFKISSG